MATQRKLARVERAQERNEQATCLTAEKLVEMGQKIRFSPVGKAAHDEMAVEIGCLPREIKDYLAKQAWYKLGDKAAELGTQLNWVQVRELIWPDILRAREMCKSRRSGVAAPRSSPPSDEDRELKRLMARDAKRREAAFKEKENPFGALRVLKDALPEKAGPQLPLCGTGCGATELFEDGFIILKGGVVQICVACAEQILDQPGGEDKVYTRERADARVEELKAAEEERARREEEERILRELEAEEKAKAEEEKRRRKAVKSVLGDLQ